MDQKLDAVVLAPGSRPAVTKRRSRNQLWARLRLATSIIALGVIAMGAWLNLDLGTFSSFRVGPLTISCPLGVAQVVAASQEFIPTFALTGAGGILLIVLFGRVFCGWLCPGRWIFNRGPFQAAKPWQTRPWVQGAIAGGVIGLSAIIHSPAFCPICPAGVVCRGAIAAGTGGSLLPTLGWLSAVTGFEWFSRRSWCRDLCPLGGAISLFSRLNPFLKVKANPERCRPCVACERACPEGLNLSRDADFSVCIKCLACQVACPRGAVEIKMYSWK